MAMQYSFSPAARREAGVQLLTGDILDMEDIRIPEDAKNTNVQILNVDFKAIGLRLRQLEDDGQN